MAATSQRVPDWLRDGLRIVAAGLVLVPGVNKFLSYETSVAFFTSLGIPNPAILVVVVGVVEVVSAGLLLWDRAVRPAAAALVPVMVVAAVTAGISAQNVAVTVAALGLLGIDTLAPSASDRQSRTARATTDDR